MCWRSTCERLADPRRPWQKDPRANPVKSCMGVQVIYIYLHDSTCVVDGYHLIHHTTMHPITTLRSNICRSRHDAVTIIDAQFVDVRLRILKQVCVCFEHCVSSTGNGHMTHSCVPLATPTTVDHGTVLLISSHY